MKRRELSKRHIQILALQRCSRAISLATANGLFMPQVDQSITRLEVDMACHEIAYQLRARLAKLSMREFPRVDPEIWGESDDLNLTSVSLIAEGKDHG